MFTTSSAVLPGLAHLALRAVASFRASGFPTRAEAVTCGAGVVPSSVFAAGADRGGSYADAAIKTAEVRRNPSSMARLAAAVSSTSERRAGRISLAGFLRVLLMIKRPLGEFSQHPALQLPGFLRGSSRLRKLGHA